MGCTLTEEEKFVLSLLSSKRSLRKDRGYHEDKLKNLYRKKFGEKPKTTFKKCIQGLLNKGHIAPVGKSPEKYFLTNHGETFKAMGECGINIPKGRIHKL